MDDIKFWAALNHFPKFGPTRFKKLKRNFPSLKEAFQANIKELIAAGIEENIAEEFAAARVKINPDQIIEDLAREQIKTATIDDEQYPKLLKELYDAPPLLYYRGELTKDNEFSLAVVGTRKFTNYGRQAAEKIVKDLTISKLVIVSGLALGIDTIAHSTALEAKGKTIAVLASGLDKRNIYPAQNRYLLEKIIATGGLVISEFPLFALPLRHHFPQRNRIISGLSLGTLVVEAGEKSGSLITARCALEQNREVFAVPGSIYSPYSVGTNCLITLGAKLVTSAADIIEALNLTRLSSFIENKKIIPDSAEEEKILTALTHEPIHIDELVRLTQLKTSVINSTLTLMEMKGMVKNLGGMQYVIAR